MRAQLNYTALYCNLYSLLTVTSEVLLHIKAMSQQDLPCTAPPPPAKRLWVGSFFWHRCLVLPKFFPKETVDFAGDIRTRTPKNLFFRHNHSNPISTKLTLFYNIE